MTAHWNATLDRTRQYLQDGRPGDILLRTCWQTQEKKVQRRMKAFRRKPQILNSTVLTDLISSSSHLVAGCSPASRQPAVQPESWPGVSGAPMLIPEIAYSQ